MDLAKPKFGSGPKELCGAVDLLSHYKLWPHHEIFCKRSLPSSLSETPYLRNVVGDKKIRKGEGMELDQLLRETSSQGYGPERLQPFELDILREAFQINEMTTSDRSYVRYQVESGIHLSASKLKIGSKNEKRHKRYKDRDAEKKKDLKKHKQHHKDARMLKENGENRILIRKFHPHQLLIQQNNGLA